MANNNETTTKFKVDISELKASMQEARRQVALSNSEFKATSSAMDDWKKSTEGLEAKLKQLNNNLDAQKAVLANYEDILEQVKEEYGENSDEAREYAIRLNNQQAVVNSIEREIRNYSDQLDALNSAQAEAAQSAADASDDMTELADAAEEAGDAAEGAEDGFSIFKGAIATFAGNVLTSLVDGLKNAAGSLLELGEATREYREMMNKLTVASQEAGYSTDYAKEKYKELYSIMGDEGAATTAISNFVALGASEENLNSLLNSAAGIWSKYGDSIALDGLGEAINHTSKLGSVQGNLADALEWSGVNVDDFNAQLAKCNTEEKRQQLIVRELNDIYGEMGAEYKEVNKDVIEAREAQADYTDAVAKLGAKIEPVTNAVQKGFSGILTTLLELVEDVDFSALTETIESAFGVLTNDVLPAIKDGFTWIKDNSSLIIGALAGIASGFLAFKVAGLITAAATALSGFSVASALAAAKTWLLNSALLANPITALVTLIIGLVAALVTFIATNEEARAKFTEIWQAIKDFFVSAVEEIVKFFTETLPEAFNAAVEWVSANWETLLLMLINPFAGLFKYFYENNDKFKEFVDTAITYIKELPPKVWSWLCQTIKKVDTWRINMTNKAKETASAFVNKIIEFIKQLPTKIWTWLVNVVNKVTTWGKNMLTKAKDIASNFVDKIIEYIRKLPERVKEWLSKTIDSVIEWGKNLIKEAKEAATDFVEKFVGYIEELPDKMKEIGKNIVKGIWEGIKNVDDWLKDKIKDWVGDVEDWIKDLFGINSPSKLMEDEVGKFLPQGIAVGIDKNAKSVFKSMKNLTASAVKEARNGLQGANSAINGITADTATAAGTAGQVVNNFYQTINSPKQLNRLDIYRQSKNLLGFAGGN